MDSRLAPFLLLSALMHGALIGWQNGATVQPPRIGGQAQALRVAIAPGNAAAMAGPTPAATSSAAQPHTSKSDMTTAPQAGARATTAPHTTTRRPLQPTIAASATSDSRPAAAASTVQQALQAAPAAVAARSDAQQVGQRISAALQQELAKRFEYPWIARKRGWQGRVTLSLQIQGNGDLTDWKVSQTSGHAVLDRSALDCARRLDRLPEAARWLDGRSLELMIPVQYRLRDS